MRSRIQSWRIRVSFFFCVAALLFFSVCRSAWEKQEPVLCALLFLAGTLLVGVASLGRLWCFLYIAGHKTKALVTQGPYSMSRNPLYFFSLLGFVGLGLCSETLLLPAIFLVAFALYYPTVIRHEEARLLQVHQQAYSEYMASTPRFFPRISSLREPEEYVVCPRLFRRRMFEALLFVWGVGLLELIEELHDLGWLPTLLNIY